MNLQKFKERDKRKIWIIGSIILIVLIVTIRIFLRSYAFFETKENYNVIKGLVPNYQMKDIKVKAYINNQLVKDFPKKEDNLYYQESNCTNNVHLLWDNFNWNYQIKDINNQSECKIYFKRENSKQVLKDFILNRYGGTTTIKNKGTSDFNSIATTDEGIYSYPDEYGDSYYYRGNIQNNYVFFAGFYWRIVRINGDDSIRLIFSGNEYNEAEDSLLIGYTQYNSEINDNAYLGYMFGETNSDKATTQTNKYSNNIKQVLDAWYKDNLQNYDSYLADNLFCNDRSIISGSGSGNTETVYSASDRVFSTKIPSLKCPQKNDRFTVYDTTIGNGALSYPIALLTADEAMLAGCVRNIENTQYYLANGIHVGFWTMTPTKFRLNHPTYGNLGINLWAGIDFGNSEIPIRSGIRPVINLKSTTEFVTGNGTKEKPFVIF